MKTISIKKKFSAIKESVEKVTEEEALRTSEKKYRTLFTSIDQGFTLCELIRNKEGKGIDFYTLEVNLTYEKQTGVDKEMVLGKKILQVFPSLNKWIETYAAVVDNQCPVVFEHYFEDTDRWFAIKAYPVEKERFAVLYNNISERKLAEEKLKESEKQFKNILLQSPNIFVILEGFPEMIITFANEPLFKSLGRTSAIIGKPLLEVLPEIKDQPFPKLLQQVFETGEPYTSKEEKAVIMKNGTLVDTYFLYICQPIFNDVRKITGVTIMATDITNQILARKKNEENKNQLQNIFLNAPAAICILEGSEHKYVLANKAYEKLVNRKAGDLLGQNFCEVFPELIGTGTIELINNVFETGETFNAPEYAVMIDLKNDGALRQFYFDFLMEPLKNDSGEIYAVMVMGYNITEQVLARKKIEETEKQKTFLLKLSDALRPLENPVDIEEAVTKIALDFMDADRCHYCTIDGDNLIILRDAVRGDFPSVVGEYQISSFPLFKAILDSGHPFIVDNVHTTEILDEDLKQLCSQLHNISFINIPVIKNGKHLGLLSLVQSKPRKWTDFEVQLTIETAERTWAAVEKAKAENALHQSEEKYRSLFNSIDEGVSTIEIIFDGNEKAVDFRFLESNPAMTKATGLTNEIHGKTAKEVLPNIEEFWLETYGRVVKTGESIRFEYRSKDLNSNWFEVHAYKVGNKQSRKIITVYNNITDRKIEEEKQKYILKLSDAIKELIDPIDIKLTACKILGEHVKVNRVLCGEVIDEEQIVINNNYVNGVDPIDATLDAEQFGRNVIDAFKRNEKVISSDITRDPNYTEEAKQSFLLFDVVANVGMGLIKAGRWVATFGMHCNAPRKWTATEIWLLEETAKRTWAAVERAKTEQALRISEEKYRNLFISIDQGFMLCELVRNKEGKGIDYNLLEINPSYEKLTGVSWEMRKGKTILQTFPTLDKWWIETYAAVVDNQRPVVFEKYFENNHRWYEVNAYPGGRDQFVTLFREITERKQAGEKIRESEKQFRDLSTELEQKVQQRTNQLVEKNAELVNMNKELEAFTYVSSHDMQEPLRKIQTFAGRILEKENHNLSDQGKNYFRLMQQSAERMQHLIQDLLAFSRLSIADRKFETIDLNIIIEEVKNEFKDAIAEKKAVIEVKEICDFKIIPFQFRQLMHNLIGNALKFSNPKIPPHITIESRNIKYSKINIANLPPQKEYCHISITDNGIGFEKEFGEKIFEVFQKLHSKEEYAGTGIGLAIVKKIVDNHNGIIIATSEINKGTIFNIYLPV